MRDTKRWGPYAVVVVLVVFSLACGEATATSQATVKTATPTGEAVAVEEGADGPTEQPEATAAPTAAPVVTYLGDAVAGNGYALAAIEVEDPAPAGAFYQPEAGKRLVAVRVVVGNASGDQHTVNPLYAVLLDQDGYTYETELAGRNGQIATADIERGEKIEGWVAFSVEEGAVPAALKYSFGGPFGGDALEASLVPAPEGHTPDVTALASTPEPPEANLGDVAEKYGYSLSAVSVDDPATPTSFYDPIRGYKLVAVEIAIGNDADETLNVNPLYVFLVDDRGYVYAAELGSTQKDQIATLELASGEKVKGWVGFSIPEDAVPAVVKFQLGVFSSDYLRVGLNP